jgi:hypothetical protein
MAVPGASVRAGLARCGDPDGSGQCPRTFKRRRLS